MSSPNNMWGGFSPYIAQPAKDSVLSALRTAYPKATNPYFNAEPAWSFVRGTANFDADNPDGRDKAYVMVNWSTY
jgi:hypothetical protein